MKKEKILKFEKMGGSLSKEVSDVENHRIWTSEYIPLEDGRSMLFEFSIYDKYFYRTTHKITLKPLKKPIKELQKKNALYLQVYYYKDNYCYGDIELVKHIDSMALEYNKENILKVVNMYSLEKYDKFEWL